jgi:hypothetical protein
MAPCQDLAASREVVEALEAELQVGKVVSYQISSEVEGCVKALAADWRIRRCCARLPLLTVVVDKAEKSWIKLEMIKERMLYSLQL